jgi:hypothetical protein
MGEVGAAPGGSRELRENPVILEKRKIIRLCVQLKRKGGAARPAGYRDDGTVSGRAQLIVI